MNKFIKLFFGFKSKTAPLNVVFLSVALVELLQLAMYAIFGSSFRLLQVGFVEFLVILGMPIFLILFFKYSFRKLIPIRSIGTFLFIILIPLTLSVDVVMDYLITGSEQIFPPPDIVKSFFDSMLMISSGREMVLKVVLLCIVPGICEEIFFRGFCQTSVASRWGNNKAILISALIFAALHNNPWYFHLYFLLGLFLAWTYAITGSLVAPITCHIINNVWSLLTHHYDIKFPAGNGCSSIDCILIIVCCILIVAMGIFLKREAKLKKE